MWGLAASMSAQASLASCTSRTAITASLPFHSDAESALRASFEGRTLTTSHGQTIREIPIVVSTCMSTPPTSVTVPRCRPSRNFVAYAELHLAALQTFR
jgi:hypothetical protein